MKRRITLITVLASMLLASLASCGGGSAQPEAPQNPEAGTENAGTEAPETEALTDGIPDTDMGGFTLKVLNLNAEWYTWANQDVVTEADGDILNDAIYNRNARLNERFNANITVDYADTSDGVMRAIKTNVMAGDPVFDVYTCNEGELKNYLPYALDWNLIPNLRLKEAWWNPNATSIYVMDGKQTALAGNMTLSAVSRSVCMVFNKNIWKTCGDPDINLYSLVENNEWTVDKFLEVASLVKKDLNGDGVMDVNDLYGLNMGRGFKGYVASFLTGSGMHFTEKDSTGAQVFTLHQNEKALNLVIRLVDALGQEGYYYNEDPSCHSFAPSDFFKNGHALFTQGVPHDIYKLRDMNDDIGILPMPKHDAEQKQYYSAAWGGAVWTLAKTFDLEKDGSNLGYLLDAMAFDTYYNVVPVYKEVALKTKTARDNESEGMLDIIFSSISFDYGTNIMYDAVYASTFLESIWKKKSSDVIVSSIEKALNKIEKEDKLLAEAVAQLG